MCLIIVLLLSTLSAASTGTYVGNGGEGVLSNGKWELLEFFESVPSAWEFKSGTFNCSLSTEAFTAQKSRKVKSLAGLLNAEDRECLAFLVSRLAEVDERLANILSVVAEKYSWEVSLDENPLSPYITARKDVGRLSSLKVATLANRYRDRIAIDFHKWSNLSSISRAGLVLHELFSAIASPVCVTDKCTQLPEEAMRVNVAILNNSAELKDEIQRFVTSTAGDYETSTYNVAASYRIKRFEYSDRQGTKTGYMLVNQPFEGASFWSFFEKISGGAQPSNASTKSLEYVKFINMARSAEGISCENILRYSIANLMERQAGKPWAKMIEEFLKNYVDDRHTFLSDPVSYLRGALSHFATCEQLRKSGMLPRI